MPDHFGSVPSSKKLLGICEAQWRDLPELGWLAQRKLQAVASCFEGFTSRSNITKTIHSCG
jgi:hypothetical protein